MSLNRLFSFSNLELAWRRINTASNLQYKRFFRDLYYAYEIASIPNLKDLQTRLQRRSTDKKSVTLRLCQDDLVTPSRTDVPPSLLGNTRGGYREFCRGNAHRTISEEEMRRASGSRFGGDAWMPAQNSD